MKKKTFLIIGIILGAGLLYAIVTFVLPIVLLYFGVITSKKTEIDDFSRYYECLGEGSDATFGKDFEGLFEVFPHDLTDVEVKDFKYVYYNPWDPQYVSYIEVQYDADAYAKELERLGQIGFNEYEGIYSVTGAPAGYELVAMKVDSYHGFGYAMIPEAKNNIIAYVGIDFCNYFLDLDIHEYIPDEYLLEGFDASSDNPYKKQRIGSQD